MNNIFIGIDPDSVKSGVAVLYSKYEVRVSCLSFPELISFVKMLKEKGYTPVIVVEAGWLNTISNYHGISGKAGMKVALSVGRNQQTGILIVEMLNSLGFSCFTKKPLIKKWKGADKKITHEELTNFIPIQKSRTNQEERDAALLVWDYCKLPIKLKL